ncbi:MAG: hypothetical protein M3Q50_12915 [Chloroflexota bacterium]|nr:hypothetical protein [Chloroflexota bacterium]
MSAVTCGLGPYFATSVALPGARRGRGFGKKTMALIEASVAFLEGIQPAGVRAVAYQLFNRRLISNMGKNETDKVSRALTTARERGLIPWEWIVDETREITGWRVWSNPGEYAEEVMNNYYRDWWVDQPERILVISEKGTVGGTLRPILQEYRVKFLIFHGFGSATALNDLARMSQEDDRPLTLLYVGDHDPSGRHMSDIDIPERLDRYGGEAKLIRLAVTPEHIAHFDLSTFPARDKAKDARYRWFVHTHGETCCELDALDPNVLRDLIEGAITDRIAWDRWHAAQADENGERATIRENLKTLKEMQWL